MAPSAWFRLSLLADKLGQRPYFVALQRGLALSLPIILVGALAQLLRDPPSRWLQRQVQALLGPQFRALCDILVSATFGIASLVVLMGFSLALTRLHNQRPGVRQVNPAAAAGIIMACFFCVVLPGDGAVPMSFLALDSGLLAALLVATAGGRLFLSLSELRLLRVPSKALGHDPLVGDIFAVLPAGALTIAIFALGKGAAMALLPAGFGDGLLRSLAGAGDSPVFAFGYILVSQCLWLFGIHGPNFLHGLQEQLFDPAGIANMAAASGGGQPPFVFTSQFFHFFTRMGGSGSTICLIAALLLASRSTRSRRFAFLACLPALFNINEPLLFGLPLVFNPVYALPFVLTPVVQALLTYGAVWAGWMPPTSADVIWTTPVLYSGYAVTGSWTGVAVQAVALLAGMALYFPFVRISEDLAYRRSRDVVRSLQGIAEDLETAFKPRRFLDLDGAPGRMAQALASDLERALEGSGQIFLEYQPQVDIATGKVCGVEALLRWQHPQYGRIPPPVVATLAEDMGAAQALGMRVLSLACRQRAAWRESLPDDFAMSVNVSPGQLPDPEFGGRVLAMVRESGMTPCMLGLEITEGTALGSAVYAFDSLRQLREQGVKIALDDFGMGHTSLHYLRQLPLDAVKLDRSLVIAGSGEVNEHIVRSLVELSRGLGVSIVAEGVENAEQLQWLEDAGCSRFQGYFFSPPLAGQTCLDFVLAWNARHGRRGAAARPAD